MSNRLTKKEIKAVLDLLSERLAGGAKDVRDALGITDDEADEICMLASSAMKKLAHRV